MESGTTLSEEEEIILESVDTVAPVVALDETVFNNLEKNMSEFIEVIKEKDLIETDRSEKLDELIKKMTENEDAATEKALLDKQAEVEAKELADAEALIVEEIDPEAVDLATIYKLLQEKMKQDAETVNSFEYLTCLNDGELEGSEEIDEVLTLCNQLQSTNEKLDILIEQNGIITFYGYFLIPISVVIYFTSKFLNKFI